MKVLITSGGTVEAIDAVRVISNRSSGKSGAAVAARIAFQGGDVTLLRSKAAAFPWPEIECEEYESFTELDSVLKEQLQKTRYDAVIHMAAVSDYSIDSITLNNRQCAPDPSIKLDSSQNISLKLRRNKKIINSLREYSLNKEIIVIAFKLTYSENHRKTMNSVKRILETGRVDFVVHNDLQDINDHAHLCRAYSRDKEKPVFSSYTKEELGEKLFHLIRKSII